MIFNFRSFLFYIFAGVLITGLSSCDLARNHSQMDRDSNMDIQNFRDGLSPREISEQEIAEFEKDSTRPEFSSYVSEPDGFDEPTPLVSVSVNQNVPLRDVLFELAKQADLDLEMDPNITGSIIMTARNKPLDSVIQRISKLAGLRYELDGKSLRVENDYPYQKTYRMPYLNILRSSATNVTTSVEISGSQGEGTSGNTNTGSNYTMDTTSEGDFWTEINNSIEHILSEDVNASLSKTQADPDISVSVSQPAPVAGTSGNTPPSARLNVQSLPTSGGSQTNIRRGGQGGAQGGALAATYSINRQSGLLTIYAPERQQKKIRNFLNDLKQQATSQVLIEAKVLEVRLSDEYSAGINWSALIEGPGSLVTDTSFFNPGGASRPTLTPDVTYNFNISAAVDNVSVFVDAISRFGTVRALASPRITVLNNQPAMLNVTESRVYFDIDVDSENDENFAGQDRVTIEIDSETFSVPEGVLINVIPSIDHESNSTMLVLKPTVTRVVGFVENPASAAAVAIVEGDIGNELADVSTTVPELSVQEFDSVINLRSGEVAVLGGLLEDRLESDREGVPIASEIPFFGNLFRAQGDKIEKSELVILIKTTILDSASGTVHDTDRELYKQFARDRRPFKL